MNLAFTNNRFSLLDRFWISKGLIQCLALCYTAKVPYIVVAGGTEAYTPTYIAQGCSHLLSQWGQLHGGVVQGYTGCI